MQCGECRHLHAVLTRGLISSLQECVEWLVEADIVQALLRAHLHQRQYVDQVQRVLKILAAEGGFQSDHLELLWALTDKAAHTHSTPNHGVRTSGRPTA